MFGLRKKTSVTMAMLLAILAGTALLAVPGAGANVYLGGGTVVFKQQDQAPDADKGLAICETNSDQGIGGGCLPFPPGGTYDLTDPYGIFGAVSVADEGFLDGPTTNVAFQVCIDNDGDSKCTSGGTVSSACADDVYFSHNDLGQFFNPLGPLPGAKKPGCEISGGWNGYVVFICEGVHITSKRDPGSNNPEPHSHPTTRGTINSADPTTSSGYGDFCGGTREVVVEKEYKLYSL